MISHHHRAIFVHVPKAGGQSIEQMFLDDLGLAWADRGKLLLQPNADPARGPERLAHLYAEEYVGRGHVAPEVWDSYFRFATVRNPYDRIVSEYLFRFRGRWFWQKPSPEAFLDRIPDDDFLDAVRHLRPQVRFLTDRSGRLLVDRVIRLEDLSQGMAEIAPRLFGGPRAVPHRNRAARPDRALKDRLRARMADRIRALYAEDFKAFGYQD